MICFGKKLMSYATLEHARAITVDIVRAIDPVSVLIFGAVAREGKGSDLDLLIVFDEADSIDSSRMESQLDSLLKAHMKEISVNRFILGVRKFRDHFRRGSPFLNVIVREGRVLYMKNAENEWLKDAADELKTAEYLHGGGYYKAACYHAQQVVEKYFKARLLGRGWELEKVHSIARLCALAADHGVAVSLADADMSLIDSIYRERNSGELGLIPLGEPSLEDSKRAFEIARRLFLQE